jgi:hypothetical protein
MVQSRVEGCARASCFLLFLLYLLFWIVFRTFFYVNILFCWFF